VKYLARIFLSSVYLFGDLNIQFVLKQKCTFKRDRCLCWVLLDIHAVGRSLKVLVSVLEGVMQIFLLHKYLTYYCNTKMYSCVHTSLGKAGETLRSQATDASFRTPRGEM
jgi:hypothetical protein